MDILKELFNFAELKAQEKAIFCVDDLHFGSRISADQAKNISLRKTLGETTSSASTINTSILFF